MNNRTHARRAPRMPVCVAASLVSTLLLPSRADAHAGAIPIPGTLLEAWRAPALTLIGAGALMILYAAGLDRMWRVAGPGRGIARWRVGAFLAGMLLLILALASPLDTLGSALFFVHMVQHEVLMVLAAPLLAVSGVNIALLRALPRPMSRRLARGGVKLSHTTAWHVLAHPFGALALHIFALLLWHAPSLYDATVTNDVVHAVQHASFLGTSVFFWWSLARSVRRSRAGYGVSILALFGATAAGSLLGALLTFAPRALYPHYTATAPLWGRTALEDQQLGGLIMWVPGGIVYIAAALGLVAAWLASFERRNRMVAAPAVSQAAPPGRASRSIATP